MIESLTYTYGAPLPLAVADLATAPIKPGEPMLFAGDWGAFSLLPGQTVVVDRDGPRITLAA